MPIWNGRWQSFIPTESGNLRQINVYYKTDNTAQLETGLTMTIWSGIGITESEFLGQAQTNTDNSGQGRYIGFPINDIELSENKTYTWQVTNYDGSGELGYVEGNGYINGDGDLSMRDYLFVVWIEGIDDTIVTAPNATITDMSSTTITTTKDIITTETSNLACRYSFQTTFLTMTIGLLPLCWY